VPAAVKTESSVARWHPCISEPDPAVFFETESIAVWQRRHKDGVSLPLPVVYSICTILQSVEPSRCAKKQRQSFSLGRSFTGEDAFVYGETGTENTDGIQCNFEMDPGM
jgi:hypothetical protein